MAGKWGRRSASRFFSKDYCGTNGRKAGKQNPGFPFFPGAAYTYVNGISPRGDLVGQYAATLNGSGPNHGFVLSRGGVFTTVDFPGGVSSLGIGMNSRGDVLGSYSKIDNVVHTFVMNA